MFKGTRHLLLVGRGSSLAAVGTGALIIKESDHFQAEGMSSGAFRHGPFEMLCDGTFVIVFAGDHKTRHLNQRLFEDVRAATGPRGVAGRRSGVTALRPARRAAVHTSHTRDPTHADGHLGSSGAGRA